MSDSVAESDGDLATCARVCARSIAKQHVPTGTKPYDTIELTLAALENLLARAYVLGHSGDFEPEVSR